MIVKMSIDAGEREKRHVIEILEGRGLKVRDASGEEYTVFGVIGDTTKIDVRDIEALKGVERVTRIQEPFKQVNRAFKGSDTIVQVGDVSIGGWSWMDWSCSREPERRRGFL